MSTEDTAIVDVVLTIYREDGKKQDVWSKKWKDVDEDDKIRKRIEFSDNLIKRKSFVVQDEINGEKKTFKRLAYTGYKFY